MTDPAADYASLFRLDGRHALVIGAGSGIGAEVARGLAAFGATVACGDVNTAAAEATAAGIGPAATAVHVDLADPASVAALAHTGEVPHVLVTTPSVNVRKRMLDYTDAELDRVVDLNLKGTFRVMTAVGRRMAEAGRGSIVAFSSIRSVTVEPGQGAYAATKAGTISLVKTLAAELAGSGVRVNAVAPGVVETPLTRPIKDRPDWYQAYADRNALRRWAQPSEMVGAVVFLAGDASSYVTGATMFVDGGWTAVDGRFDPPS
jgi:NAD(P)-dependent dehydrogenase (short-subunit alcohol dehydrogenase family)